MGFSCCQLIPIPSWICPCPGQIPPNLPHHLRVYQPILLDRTVLTKSHEVYPLCLIFIGSSKMVPNAFLQRGPVCNDYSFFSCLLFPTVLHTPHTASLPYRKLGESGFLCGRLNINASQPHRKQFAVFVCSYVFIYLMNHLAEGKKPSGTDFLKI